MKELMKECEFAKELKCYMLPTKKELIGHYYYYRNFLMVSEAAYLRKRTPFHACTTAVVNAISNLWRKSNLPIINH